MKCTIKKIELFIAIQTAHLSHLQSLHIRILLAVTDFFSVAYLISFLPVVSACFPFVSDSCSYPSFHLCLPLYLSFLVVNHLIAAKGARS